MSQADYSRALDYLAALLPELAASEVERPVRPPVELERAAALVPALGPSRALGEVLDSIRALALAAPLTTTPRFFNQLFSGRDAAATAAEMVAAHLNVSMYTYKAAGPLILMENALIEHMLEVAGFAARGEGTFTSGGSISNLLALALARNEAAAREGEARAWAVYTSAESHYSLPKAAALLGLGREAVRKVDVDAEGRMRPDALEAMLRADLDAGRRPVMINATAATTVMGAFDPIAELADIARACGIWIHVDAAWGGSLLLAPARRQLFAGLERCDSLTWDAHKLMGVPLTCSVLLLRESGLLERHLGADAEYLFQTHGPEHNPGLRSIQCGRRNDPFKLWAAWQHHGDAGFAARVERLLELRDHVVARVESEPRLRMCHRPQFVNVCFEMDGVSSEQLCAQLNARGLAVVGHGRVFGRSSVRLIVANPEQDEAVLDRFIDDLLAVGASL